MQSTPVVSRITIYPVKSLDGVSLEKAEIGEGGCLLHDREYAMIDDNGKFINGKSNPLVHSLRSTIDLASEIISLRATNELTWSNFHLKQQQAYLESYLTEYFGINTRVIHDKAGGFLDIPGTAGLTTVSTASLQEVASWFAEIDLEESRKRFRATIEIGNVDAFWEDHLFSEGGKAVEFKIADVKVIGMSPRERCVVPTRSSTTGMVTHAFPKSFARHRAETIPGWSMLEEYGHHYYLAVNCYIPSTEIGKTIEVGNEVTIIGEKVFALLS